MDTLDVVVPLVTLIVSVGGSWLVAERKLRTDHRLQFQAERVALALMSTQAWELRSFDRIKHHLAGFDDDELRRVLVRAGAVRFEGKDGEEMWGLLERNRGRMGGG